MYYTTLKYDFGIFKMRMNIYKEIRVPFEGP